MLQAIDAIQCAAACHWVAKQDRKCSSHPPCCTAPEERAALQVVLLHYITGGCNASITAVGRHKAAHQIEEVIEALGFQSAKGSSPTSWDKVSPVPNE